MSETDQLQRALDREYPLPGGFPSDWDDVLLRVASSEPAPLRLRRWSARIAMAVALAAGIALLSVAPWQRAERAGVLERALAAFGDGPVTHLVLREQAGTLVDLETLEREPLYRESELWIDPERGFASVTRVGDTVESRLVASPREIEAPFGVLATGYREALESGTARLAGSGVVAGIPVHWIQVHRETDARTGEEWALEVGVAKDGYEPVYVRSTRGGEVEEGSGSRVLTAERRPAGSGDFRPAEPLDRGSPLVSREAIGHDEASAILDGRAAWLGEEFEGLRLTTIRELTIRRRDGSVELGGVRLVYGTSYGDGAPAGSGPGIVIQQAPRGHALLGLGLGTYRPPPGVVVVNPEGSGHVDFEGTYVSIRVFGAGDNSELALSAARALRPLSGGSAAGG